MDILFTQKKTQPDTVSLAILNQASVSCLSEPQHATPCGETIFYLANRGLGYLEVDVRHWVPGLFLKVMMTSMVYWVPNIGFTFPMHLAFILAGLLTRASPPKLCQVWKGCDVISPSVLAYVDCLFARMYI